MSESERRISTILVDDERIARAELRRLLQAHPRIDIVAEAASAEEALELINRLRPELVFLDIQMPGISGMQLAAEIEGRCQFVFCTAYDSFAIDAFGLNALDYLVKPVAPERLARSLSRLRVDEPKVAPTLAMDHGLLLKFGDYSKIVRLNEIDRIDSVGNHAAVHTQHGIAHVLSSLNRIEQRLDPEHFCRVSRRSILRLDAIENLAEDVGHGLIAMMRNGDEVAVSRRASQGLRSRMGGFD